MAKSGKVKKIIAGLVVGVLATTAIVCVAVPQVRNKLGDLINEIKNKFKSEEEKNNDRKEQIHDDDHYKDLDDDEKKDFDDKFKQIIDSDEYKEKTDKEKDELINKFVESEKLQKEVEEEQIEQETRKEEVKEEMGSVSESLKKVLESENPSINDVQQEISNTKNELNDIINSETASAEEIAEAQEKLDKVEKAEQEYVYQETSSAIKEQMADNEHFQNKASGMTLRKINGIYSSTGAMTVIVNADFVQKETIGGVDIYSQISGFCQVYTTGLLNTELSYSDVINEINKGDVIQLLTICSNQNDAKQSEERRQFFEENKYSIHKMIQAAENNKKYFSVVDSWDRVEAGKVDTQHSTYHVRVTNENGKVAGESLLIYNGSEYIMYNIEKVCPEFWAQLEVEQNKQSQQAQAEASVEQFATRNEAGEMKSFDYTAFRKAAEEKKAKQKTPIETKQSNVLYDDLDLSL